MAIEDRRKENEISKIRYKNRYPEAKQTPWDDPSGDLTVQKSVCRNRDDSLFIIPREAIPYDYIVLLDASRY